jgi:5-methylcytosine-specific restriction endonuclease McrA
MSKTKKPWSPNGYLFAAARKVFRWSPERKAVIAESERLAGDTGQRFCVGCKRVFNAKAVAIDHKEPVVDPNVGFVSWDTYYARLFVGRELLQPLCTECHGAKTKAEGQVRKVVRREKKAEALNGQKKKSKRPH